MIVNLKTLLKALLISIITIAVLLFIFAFICVKSMDSTKNIELYGRIIFFVSAFTGCLYASCNSQKAPLINSLIFGASFITFSYLISLFSGGAKISRIWIAYLGIIAISLVCSFIGIKKKPRKPKGLKAFKKMSKG